MMYLIEAGTMSESQWHKTWQIRPANTADIGIIRGRDKILVFICEKDTIGGL